MIKNKKSLGRTMKLIIGLPIIILIGMFMTIGLFQLGEDIFIEEVHNISVEAGQNANINDSYITTLNNLKDDFSKESPNFELLFALLMVIVFASSVFVAIKSEPLPTISFLGSAVFGIAIMLLIIVFIDQFVQWYLNDFFYQIFDRVDNILLDWYFDNLSLISTIWMAILLFLNQVDIENVKRGFSGREGGGIIEE